MAVDRMRQNVDPTTFGSARSEEMVSVIPWHDRATWNEFIASTPHGHFQQSWEWGELASDLDSRALRFAAVRGDTIVGATQIFVSELSRSGYTHFYVPRGPAVCEPSVEILGPLMDRARLTGEEMKTVGIRVEPPVAATAVEWESVLRSLGLRPTFPPRQPRSSWMLDITPDCDTLLANMKQKTRYNIRLAARKGVEVVEAGPEALDTFYQLFCETAARDDFFVQRQGIYQRMYSLFRQAGNFRMLFARYQEEVIAAVTLLRLGATCWYLQGASSTQHRGVMAPTLLQWEAIQQAKLWGCTLYDFRAIPDVLREGEDMWGVYRFKEGFGGHSHTVLHTFSAAYQPALFGLWQLYYRAGYDLESRRRRRQGRPVRQFA